ncbi:hypothetical protein [Denitrobaculum tricleocarpae]|uniref:Lipoprotein n=1 Tax=Denitrobaculum tricleocarpae TaxID=2591009 RepID=A0A545TTT5_9PROT|nr:hypothetical protein [Denitrobaculum tricleocarpae]TQV80561.1 hypothetical protein FKG95_10335 [Denitrobaculum tricleocarpae]
MRLNRYSTGALLIGAVILSACASERDLLLEQGYPVAYADGFEDGCHSGKKAGGALFEDFKKDVNRFEADSKYAQGWSDGFRQCESEQEAMDRQMRMALEIQQMEEARKDRIGQDALKGIDTSGLKGLK